MDQQEELTELRAELDRVRSERLALSDTDGEPAQELHAKESDLLARISALQDELAVISERSYYNQKVWKRVVVILAGPAVNLLIAFVIVWAIFLANGKPVYTANGQPVPNTTVAAVEKHAPATGVLRPGDRVVSVDGAGGSFTAIHRAIERHRCAGPQVSGCSAASPARVVVERNGQLQTFYITPRYNAVEKAMLLGFSPGLQMAPVGAGAAASLSVDRLWWVTKQTLSAVAHIVHPAPKQRLSSVVGAATVTQESFAHDTTQGLWVLALISLSLAIINLFPFLPLDGGHVFWAVAEKVRGRKIPYAVMERASAVGFLLIIVVFAIGLSNDISTLTGSGFNVH
jgi:regulator of sigma E protease